MRSLKNLSCAHQMQNKEPTNKQNEKKTLKTTQTRRQSSEKENG